MSPSVESLAIGMASAFFTESGGNVLSVSRLGNEHAGYDLFLTKGQNSLKVEVKGSSKPYHGIPDLYGSEVDANGRLVADILCVCYFPSDRPAKLAIIRRGDIPVGGLVQKLGYRIKTVHKNSQSIKGKLIDSGTTWDG